MDKNTIFQIIQNHQPEIIGNQRHYSVFLPFIRVDGEYHILYQVRASHIPQGGETSFPGGAIEPGENPEIAAIRETHEELNISKDQIHVWSEIDYIVSDWAIIHCFVGELYNVNLEDIQPNEEVDYVFNVPLSQLLEQEPIIETVQYQAKKCENFPYELINQGKDYSFRTMHHQIIMYELADEMLWGLTASLTHQFIKVLRNGINEFDSLNITSGQADK